MRPGIVVDPAILQFEQARFRTSQHRERGTRGPGPAAIVAVECIAVALGEVLAPLSLVQVGPASILVHGPDKDLGRHEEPPLLLSMAEGDSGITAISGGQPAIPVRFDQGLPGLPGLPVVPAPVEGPAWRQPHRKSHDIAGGFVHAHIPQFAPPDVLSLVAPVVGHVGPDPDPLPHHDGLAPGPTTVLAALHFHPLAPPLLLEHQHCAVHRDREMPHDRNLFLPHLMKGPGLRFPGGKNATHQGRCGQFSGCNGHTMATLHRRDPESSVPA